MRVKHFFAILFIILLSGSCKKIDKDFDKLLDNPNLPTPTSADVDLYLNTAQLNFPDFFYSLSNEGGTLTRMEAFFGPLYTSAQQPQFYDGIWRTAYTGILKNIDAMIPVAVSQKKFMHVGIGRILKAYTLITLVDYFGDIPYTQAVKGIENLNPAVDKGRTVYDSSIALLNQAKLDLAQTSPKPANDLFYGGSNANWIAAANSLLLKIYIQTRLVDAGAKAKIDALITDNKLISTSSQNFTYKYGTKELAPDSRHPKYAGNYTSGGASDYLGNYFLNVLFKEKGFQDPRIRYYFYRQTLDITKDITDPVTLQFTVPCITRPFPSNYPAGSPFCMVAPGYFGRDHGNNEGGPPDAEFITTWGVYPVGGQFDADQGKATRSGVGGKGQGIQPIWMSFFTDFVRAEAALTLGTAGDPKILLLSAIDKSLTYVRDFPASVGVTVDPKFAMTQKQIDDYKKFVGDAYTNAATTSDKLEIIMKEYYIALWGNGIESYNNYRRTGKPSNMQLVLATNPGPFIRSFLYPSVYVNLNKNAAQKPNTAVQVFWDINPATGFLK